MKPIDKAILGMVSELPGRNVSEPTALRIVDACKSPLDWRWFGGTVGKRFGKEKRLGILFGGSYDYNGRGIDDIETAPQTASLVDGGPVFGTYGGTDLREYRYERTRFGFGGTLDYKLSDVSYLYVRGLFSHFNNFGDRWVYSPTVNSYVANPTAGGPIQGGPAGNMSFNAQIRRPVQTIGSVALGGQSFAGRNTFTYEFSGSRATTEDKGYATANFGPVDDNSPLNNVKLITSSSAST